MNIDTLENHLEKNSVKKLKKTVKCKVKLPYVNKKTTNEKKNFCVQTSFSHSTVKLSAKTSRRKTTRFFAPIPVSA